MPLRALIIIYFICNCLFLKAQQRFILDVQSPDNPSVLKSITYKKSFLSKTERDTELKNVLFTCYDNAYLTASYDSIIEDSIASKAYLNFGKQYKWAYLKKGNVDEGVLSEIGFREKIYSNKPVYFKDVKKIQERLITYYENNGYPFASITLDSINVSDATLAAQLKLTKNKEVKIDSILVKGTAKISPVYIHNYLGIKQGNLYDESKLKNINTRLSELPFITTTSPARVLFTTTHTKLILNLNNKHASQFDGIAGLMTDPKTQKTIFTGNLHLMLQNGLGKGELIDISWSRLKAQTQDIKLRLVYPFIFRSPFGIDYNFELYKLDTTFSYVNNNVGLQYLLTGGNYLKIFYNNKISSILSTSGLENLTQLPQYGDVTENMYGIGLKHEKLDYRLNPRKGFYIMANVSVGDKIIRKNPNLNPIVYNNVALKSALYSGDLDASLFIPIKQTSTFKMGVKSAFIQGQNLFQNELFRIGGLNTLRGFNVQSIFASAYSVFTLEYRLLLERNSYLCLFTDGAYYENLSTAEHIHDTPIGFGAGVNFQTKAGIFSINYALGKQFSNPISLRNGVISFGLVNYF